MTLVSQSPLGGKERIPSRIEQGAVRFAGEEFCPRDARLPTFHNLIVLSDEKERCKTQREGGGKKEGSDHLC
jgi:hypothetical protein